MHVKYSTFLYHCTEIIKFPYIVLRGVKLQQEDVKHSLKSPNCSYSFVVWNQELKFYVVIFSDFNEKLPCIFNPTEETNQLTKS